MLIGRSLLGGRGKGGEIGARSGLKNTEKKKKGGRANLEGEDAERRRASL